jgi:succinoglycan biosynthesis protein ExoA
LAANDVIPQPRDSLPTVSVVVPVLNEARHIERCLRSAQAQDYPASLIDITVADGGSTDATRETVMRLAADDSRIRLIDNPGRKQAAGLNLAIASSAGEVVARLDGHAEWRPWHIRRCVELLRETGADNVGGTMEAVGDTFLGKAAARASSSPFGVGGARYRYWKRVTETDTVFLGCYTRSALDRVGPFNEWVSVHEDYELNYRIRQSGGKIVFSPGLPTTYWARTTWQGLARQFFGYGRAKSAVARAKPGVIRPYHLVPPTTVAMAPLLAALCVTPAGRRLSAGVVGLYATACLVASVPAGRGQPGSMRAAIAMTFPVLHFSWGLGFLVGLLASTPGTGRRPRNREQDRRLRSG